MFNKIYRIDPDRYVDQLSFKTAPKHMLRKYLKCVNDNDEKDIEDVAFDYEVYKKWLNTQTTTTSEVIHSVDGGLCNDCPKDIDSNFSYGYLGILVHFNNRGIFSPNGLHEHVKERHSTSYNALLKEARKLHKNPNIIPITPPRAKNQKRKLANNIYGNRILIAVLDKNNNFKYKFKNIKTDGQLKLLHSNKKKSNDEDADETEEEDTESDEEDNKDDNNENKPLPKRNIKKNKNTKTNKNTKINKNTKTNNNKKNSSKKQQKHIEENNSDQSYTSEFKPSTEPQIQETLSSTRTKRTTKKIIHNYLSTDSDSELADSDDDSYISDSDDYVSDSDDNSDTKIKTRS